MRPAGPEPTTATRRPVVAPRGGGVRRSPLSLQATPPRSAAARLRALMETARLSFPLLQSSSQGAGHTLPSTPGKGTRSRTTARESPNLPSAARRTYLGTSIPAGHL